MKLHALNRQRAMAQTHDDVAVRRVRAGGNFKLFRKPLFSNNQRVITRAGGSGRNASEQRVAVVLHLACLAVHQLWCTDHLAPKSRTDGLVAKADTQDGCGTLLRVSCIAICEVADQIDRNSGILRCARPWRDQDAIGMERFDLRRRELIIAANDHFLAQLAEILHQVVGERVVVIKHEDHFYEFTPMPKHRAEEDSQAWECWATA